MTRPQNDSPLDAMRAELSAETIRESVIAQICPFCGRGPFRVVASHITRRHAIDRRELRDMAGLLIIDSICDAEVSQRASAHGREHADAIREAAKRGRGRTQAPQYITAAGAARKKYTSSRIYRGEKSRVTREKHSVGSKRAYEEMRSQGSYGHGTVASFRRGCRCERCIVASRVHRQMLAGHEMRRHIPANFAPQELLRIREDRNRGMTFRELSVKYNANTASLCRFLRGKQDTIRPLSTNLNREES